VDTLVSGGKLVGIRNKQQMIRTFTPPSAAKKVGLRFFTLGLMPLLLVIGAFLYATWRRRLREAYSNF